MFLKFALGVPIPPKLIQKLSPISNVLYGFFNIYSLILTVFNFA